MALSLTHRFFNKLYRLRRRPHLLGGGGAAVAKAGRSRWPRACGVGLAVWCALVTLTGCGPVTAYVRGVVPINLNENNESTPVAVRFYQLASPDKFQAATFESLWTNDAAQLGKDRIAEPMQINVVPGNAGDPPQEVNLGSLSPSTNFIGVMALYRRSNASETRTLVIPVDDIGKRVIEFTGYSVALELSDTKPSDSKPSEAKPTNGTVSDPPARRR